MTNFEEEPTFNIEDEHGRLDVWSLTELALMRDINLRALREFDKDDPRLTLPGWVALSHPTPESLMKWCRVQEAMSKRPIISED